LKILIKLGNSFENRNKTWQSYASSSNFSVGVAKVAVPVLCHAALLGALSSPPKMLRCPLMEIKKVSTADPKMLNPMILKAVDILFN
jgi:hypothetical protein